LGDRELDKFGMAAALSRDRGFPDASAFPGPNGARRAACL